MVSPESESGRGTMRRPSLAVTIATAAIQQSLAQDAVSVRVGEPNDWIWEAAGTAVVGTPPLSQPLDYHAVMADDCDWDVDFTDENATISW